MALEKVGYKNLVLADGSAVLKPGPAGFFGFVVSGGSAVTITVYDGIDNSGTVIYAKASLVQGDVVHFGGVGLAANKGLYVVISGAGAAANFLYT